VGRKKEFVSVEEKREKPVVTPVEEKVEVVKGFRMPEPSLLKMTLRGKRSIRSSASTDSLASTSSSSSRLVSSPIETYTVLTSSSVTIIGDSIQEVWLLRCNEAKKKPKDSATTFGILWSKHHRHEPASYYAKLSPPAPPRSRLSEQNAGALTPTQSIKHSSRKRSSRCQMRHNVRSKT
jgi:hypothetical protein